ncbi:hypothetical protein WA026_013791 [Henosepilachna vigintioctopunctata]|uniref:Uncharacterized protein n=1 Tax=Henosepilachna vigintioctopunctata TaxID=420089 RepID=A0AAW1UXR0_9CUCU
MGSEPADSKKELGESETKRKDVIAAASSEVETRVKAPLRRSSQNSELKASASAPDSQRHEEEDDEPKLKTPTEFQTTDEGGAYSAETKPVYSKVLGMSLPQYMLEKSEFEKEFDASSKYH